MRRKLILHVGPHKTGTTYIQKYLYLNRHILLKHGWDYPRPIELNPNVDHYGHIKLGFDESQILYYLSNSKSENIIFSSENLYILDENKMHKLFEAIIDAEFEKIIIVIFVRNPIDRIYSNIKELIKEGWTYTIPEFLSIYLLNPIVRPETNYTIFLDKIKKIISENVEIIIVDYEYFSKTSLLTPLIEIMKIPVNNLILKDEFVNKSLEIEFVEILRFLNAKCKEFGVDPHGYKVFSTVREFLKFDNEFKEIIEKLQNAMVAYKEIMTIGSFIPSALENILVKKYSNAFYKNIHTSWDKFIQIEFISQEWLLNKKLLDTLDILFQKIVTSLKKKPNEIKIQSIIENDLRKIVYIKIDFIESLFTVQVSSTDILITYLPDNQEWNLLCIAPKDTTSIPLVIKYLDGSEEKIEVKI